MEALAAQANHVLHTHVTPLVHKMQPFVSPLYQGHLYFQDLLDIEHNAIPHMGWEGQLSKVTGLSHSQFRFTLALFLCVPFAAGVRLFRNPTLRHLYALVSGIILAYYPFGSGIFTVIPMALAAYLALLLAPRRAGSIAWCTVFPYLIYLHVCNASGASWKTGNLDFTGGAMVAVLKLIAVCVCRQDSFRKNKEDLSPYQAAHQLTVSPTPLEFVSYLFGLGDLLSGPFFEFAEYKEFMELKGPWAPDAAEPLPSVIVPGVLTVLEAVFYMCLYLALTLSGWSMEDYHSAWYYSQPMVVRCGVMVLVGLVYQLRYYFSWKITEAGFIFSGFDFLGYDETSGLPLWGRCRNCSFLGVWLADSARNVPLNWNICTGNFLRRYVYERVAPRKGRPGFKTLLFTQLVSAIWHGLYPGYLMFFVGTAIWIYFSQVLYKSETYMPSAIRQSLPYHAIKVVWTGLVLNYMASAFQLLDLKPCIQAYASLHYFPFIIMLVVNVLGSFVKPKRPPKVPTGPGGATPPAANGKAGSGNKAD